MTRDEFRALLRQCDRGGPGWGELEAACVRLLTAYHLATPPDRTRLMPWFVAASEECERRDRNGYIGATWHKGMWGRCWETAELAAGRGRGRPQDAAIVAAVLADPGSVFREKGRA